MYKERTEGSLKKFFEMFQNGKTNEEVMQYFAKSKLSILTAPSHIEYCV